VGCLIQGLYDKINISSLILLILIVISSHRLVIMHMHAIRVLSICSVVK